MTLEQLPRIRALIAQARAKDPLNEALVSQLRKQAPSLHSSIQLPPDQAAEELARFVLRYIEHVPDFVDAICDLTREYRVHQQIRPLLTIACDYFVSPPDIVDTDNEMEALLDEAYLAHRLLEEVNDRFISDCSIPLVPVDMTRANLIAHALIGEPFATELDQAVIFSADLLLSEHRFDGDDFKRYIVLHQQRGWERDIDRWPCLAQDLGVGVRFRPH